MGDLPWRKPSRPHDRFAGAERRLRRFQIVTADDAPDTGCAGPQSRFCVQQQLVKMNVDPAPAQTPQQFQSFIESEYERWGKTIRGANIRAE